MKRFLIALTVILSPLTATAQWVPDYSQQAQQQMLEQQRQQTAVQQQMLQEIRNQQIRQQLYQQQQQQQCQPQLEPYRPFGSFIDGYERGGRR
jgi:type II secretory pathway pseudopilin PulG